MVTAEQFEKMAETLFFQVIGGGPKAWDLAPACSKDSWRRVTERQLTSAGVEFERQDPARPSW